MPYYPVFLDLREHPVLVIGGGDVATRKVSGLLAAGARVTVVAPRTSAEIDDLAGLGRVALERREYRDGDLRGFDLAIAATDDATEQSAIADEARAEGVWLNVVDVPERCDFIAPAVLARGDLQVAVSTSGSAPALAAGIRDRIAGLLGDDLAVVVDIHRRLRERLKSNRPAAPERAQIFRALVESDLEEHVRARDEAGIDRLLREIAGADVSLAALGVALSVPPEDARG